ncbi:MAG: hypothetical protein KAR83_01685 [Thermodesulfovibrionales bacterium]|nr:hypothetical protein [Thermodesulfovibrionales bacterium]
MDDDLIEPRIVTAIKSRWGKLSNTTQTSLKAYALLLVGMFMHLEPLTGMGDDGSEMDYYFFLWNASPYPLLIIVDQALKSKSIIILCSIIVAIDFMLASGMGLIYIFIPFYYIVAILVYMAIVLGVRSGRNVKLNKDKPIILFPFAEKIRLIVYVMIIAGIAMHLSPFMPSLMRSFSWGGRDIVPLGTLIVFNVLPYVFITYMDKLSYNKYIIVLCVVILALDLRIYIERSSILGSLDFFTLPKYHYLILFIYITLYTLTNKVKQTRKVREIE